MAVRKSKLILTNLDSCYLMGCYRTYNTENWLDVNTDIGGGVAHVTILREVAPR